MITTYVFKKVDNRAPREGVKGKGVRLPYSCGFCKDHRFRSRRERVQHASRCKE